MKYTTPKIDGGLRKVADDVEETRYLEFVISTAQRDRHHTVLNPKKWDLKNYKNNGIVGYQHDVYGGWFSDNNPDKLLGPGRAFVEDDKLIGGVTFETADLNPLAEKMFRKVLNGTIKSTSVGFMEIGKGKWGEDEEARGEKNETYYFEGQELLEWSIVNIPSNPGATARNFNPELFAIWVSRFLKDDHSFADIEKMTVREIMDYLSGKQLTTDKSEEATKKAKDFIKNLDKGIEYMGMLNK